MVKILESTVKLFIYEKIIISLFIAFIIGTVLAVIWGMHMLLSFIVGYMAGCLYFLLISYSTYSIFKRRYDKIRIFHFLGFFFRYFSMAIIFIFFIKYSDINIFALVGGMIVVHLALVISAFLKKTSLIRGGIYGRG